MERVSVIEGDGEIPVLIVAPHGCSKDDYNTALIAETIADRLNCYAVINRGWERSDQVDFLNDKANCNNLSHCHEDVVRQEFLHPVLKYVKRMQKENLHKLAFVFNIHGVGNAVKNQVENGEVDIIIGRGGKKNKSCIDEVVNNFIYHLRDEDFYVCLGKSGGKYAGAGEFNLNQTFCSPTWYYDKRVSSLQLEIVRDIRGDNDVAVLTGKALADCIEDMVEDCTNPTGGIPFDMASILSSIKEV